MREAAHAMLARSSRSSAVATRKVKIWSKRTDTTDSVEEGIEERQPGAKSAGSVQVACVYELCRGKQKKVPSSARRSDGR